MKVNVQSLRFSPKYYVTMWTRRIKEGEEKKAAEKKAEE